MPQYSELTRVLSEAKYDDSVLVLLLTGSGDYFSSGADVSAIQKPEIDIRDQPVSAFMWEIMHFPKPIIACVNGPAIGIGFTLLPHCDIVLCTENAYFWSPFARIAVSVLSHIYSHACRPCQAHSALSFNPSPLSHS